MELHERISTGSRVPAQQQEPFADLKNRVHMAVISELGPQLFNIAIDPSELRNRVTADIRRHLNDEAGLAREDRERLTAEILDDILGYGPLERLIADESITEIMCNGSDDVWIERGGKLYETTVRFTDESHLRRIINKIVSQVGRRIDEASPMVDARLPDGSRVNAIIPPLSLSGPAPDDPEVLEAPPDDGGHDQHRLALRGVGRVPLPLHRGPAEHAHLRRYGLGQDDAPERADGVDPEQRAHRHDRGRRRAPAPPAPRSPARGAPAEHRGRGPRADPRARAQLAAHAARPHHRRRGPRRRGARHAPGHEHGP